MPHHDFLMLLMLVPLFMLTAAVYSSVGFGGGSTYLALLALVGVSYTVMPSTALICNIVVTSVGCAKFAKAGYLRSKTVLPFLVSSVPLAYLGGRIPVDQKTFLWLLSFSLLAASVRLFLSDNHFKSQQDVSLRQAWVVGFPIGAVLGFLSGVTGIGGGIFLAPVLYFLGWAEARVVAASASIFILANSLAGLWGQWTKNKFTCDPSLSLVLVVAVLIGSVMGSRWGATQFSPLHLRRVTAVLILVVSLNILWTLVGKP